MRDLTVKLLHEIVGGRLRLATLAPPAGEHASIPQIVTDSRHCAQGDVFWGLTGTRFDGSSFAEEAYDRGAQGVVVNRYVQPRPWRWSLEVDDARNALVRLAAWNRSRFQGAVVAVTGSVGKTTTRDMIYSVLSTTGQGSKSPKNYNNHLGLPLSMLAIDPNHHFSVLELAASASGEIAALAGICRPRIGVITRIGEAHLGGFGSIEALAETKAELLSALPDDGWAVLPGDDPWMRRIASRCRGQVIWTGRSLDCDVVATDIRSREGRLSFCVDGHELCVPVWGRHHVTSALAAVAVGKIFGLSMADIACGLAQFEPPPMRCQVMRVGGTTIINDAYNASPSAMTAALELLRDFETTGRRVVVCGDMRELGDAAADLHRRLGEQIVTLCGADLLVACGHYAADVVAAARDAGMPFTRAVACRERDESLAQLDRLLEPDDVVLVKGSRALGMERLVDALQARAARLHAGKTTLEEMTIA